MTEINPSSMAKDPSGNRAGVRVVIATTMMLSFISFWRAAAIVLNDLGSSAFYVAGIAEQAVGKAAPWFILGVMLFANFVRAIYVESCAMFTRGGVYKVVKEALGGTLAKLSVSAIMFDYILTGPISGVSAGQYIVGLIAQTMTIFGHPWAPTKETINLLAAGIAVLVIAYFWWRNIQGIHESSEDALNIMKVTTVMVVVLIGWSLFTLVERGPAQIPPAPLPQNLSFSHEAVGWVPQLMPGVLREIPAETASDTTVRPETEALASSLAEEPGTPATEKNRYGIISHPGMLLGIFGLIMAFGHSMLAMSGEESLAQVNREIEHPKHKNLIRAGVVIAVYSLIFTGLVSLLATMIIPDAVRPHYFDNMISGLTMNLEGPLYLRLFFQAFVVVVGFLMLSGAVNTAIIGSNGVLNRVAEDGVLIDWFREPHRKYGTTYRLINIVAILQIATVILSRGEVYVLGEAYAFGVIWSFAFKGLSMIVLRFTYKGEREWRVPGNLRIGRVELPIGMGAIALLLILIAIINLFTKQVATVSGLALSLIFFTIFTISEQINKRKATQEHGLERFTLNYADSINTETVQVRPGNVLVAVRDFNTLDHLQSVLDRTNTDEQDIVVMTVRLIAGQSTGEIDISTEENFSEYEQKLFTRVVAIAEEAGKPVQLLTVPAMNIFDAVAQTIPMLDSAEVVAGLSAKLTPEEQSRQMGLAWERLKIKARRPVQFRLVEPGKKDEYTFSLGAHAPRLTEDDINKVHKIWLHVTRIPIWKDVHHRDVVTVALARLDRDLRGDSGGVLADFQRIKEQNKSQNKKP